MSFQLSLSFNRSNAWTNMVRDGRESKTTKIASHCAASQLSVWCGRQTRRRKEACPINNGLAQTMAVVVGAVVVREIRAGSRMIRGSDGHLHLHLAIAIVRHRTCSL